MIRRLGTLLVGFGACWWVASRPDPRLSDDEVNAGTPGKRLFAPVAALHRRRHEPRRQPEHPFVGRVDEVRVSNVARYTRPFRPDRRHEPDEHTVTLFHLDHDLGGVFPDASGNHNHGWHVGSPRLEEERVR